MNSFRSFIDVVEDKYAEGCDARWDFPEEGGSLGFREILEKAKTIAGALASMDVHRGDRIGILMENGSEYPSLLLGCWYVGATVVPLRPKPGKLFDFREYVSRVHSQCRFRLILTQEKHLEDLNGFPTVIPGQLATDRRCEKPVVLGTDDHAIIQYSSGSTGQPKGVIVTHRMVVAQLDQINRELSTGCRGMIVRASASWLPLNHDMGLFIGLLNPLYLAANNLLSSPKYYMARPRRWFQLMSTMRTDLHFTTNTAVASALPGLETLSEPLDLSCLYMYLGAERVFPSIVRRAENVFGRCGMKPHQFRVGYGMAENTLGAASTRGDAIRTGWFLVLPDRRVEAVSAEVGHAVELVSLGSPHDNNQIEILDEKGNPQESGRLGEISISGPCVMPGYLDNPKESARALQRGFLHTGDLGFRFQEEIWFHSRKDDLVVVGGRNLAPDDIEGLVESLDFVRPGGAAFFGVVDEETGTQKPCLVIEPKLPVGEPYDEKYSQTIRSSVLASFGIVLHQVIAVPPGGVEKTSSGKKRRQVVASRLCSGELTRRQD